MEFSHWVTFTRWLQFIIFYHYILPNTSFKASAVARLGNIPVMAEEVQKFYNYSAWVSDGQTFNFFTDDDASPFTNIYI